MSIARIPAVDLKHYAQQGNNGTMAGFFVKTKSDGKVQGGPGVQGPFTGAQLKSLAKQGRIKPHFLLSQDQQVWHEASSVKGLLSSVEQQPQQPQQPQRPASLPQSTDAPPRLPPGT